MSHNTAKVWYNNGVIEGMYDSQPKGWEKGRLVKDKERQKLDIMDKVRKSNFKRPQRKS